MDPITLEHIFEPYFTTKEVGKGTGFGLAVVHGIVKRHGGAITVNSSPGMGTTFYVYLPMVEDTCALDDDMEGTVPEGTESILFVDDEKVLANLASEMLEQLGYRIRTSTSSVEALSLFRTAPHEFDLIITDYTMPQMTGVDLATEILLIRPDMPIILCTGFSEKVNEAVTRKTGIKELVMKPFSMRSIAKVIRRALDDSHK
jgi:CheY-like chemotaxis protein